MKPTDIFQASDTKMFAMEKLNIAEVRNFCGLSLAEAAVHWGGVMPEQWLAMEQHAASLPDAISGRILACAVKAHNLYAALQYLPQIPDAPKVRLPVYATEAEAGSCLDFRCWNHTMMQYAAQKPAGFEVVLFPVADYHHWRAAQQRDDTWDNRWYWTAVEFNGFQDF